MMPLCKPLVRGVRWLVAVVGLLSMLGGPVALAQEGDTPTGVDGDDAAQAAVNAAMDAAVDAAVDPAAVDPAEPPAFVSSLVRTIRTSTWTPPSSNPAGILYLPGSNTFLINDSEIDEPPRASQINIFELRHDGTLPLVDTWSTLAFSDEPTDLALNPSNGHLFISDDTGAPRAIYELEPGSDGEFGTSDDVVSAYNVKQLADDIDPEGIAYAAEWGLLFIVDGQNSRMFRLSPGENSVFEGVPPAGDDRVIEYNMLALGLDQPKGIVYDPATGHLFLVGKSRSLLYEITITGELVQTIDIEAALPHNPEGVALAPSSVDPAVTNVYITATGVDNDVDPKENDGMIYEMTLPDDWMQAVILISGSSSGQAKGLAFDDEDIVAYDSGTKQWHMFFDGSDLFPYDVDVNAFTLLNEGNPLPTILMSFSLLTWLPKIGWVYPQDIVKFVPTSLGGATGGSLSVYFDGSKVGLSTLGERLDAIGFTPDGRLVISTLGDFSVPNVSGRGEDLLVRNQNGWQIYFEGSDIGLGEDSEDIWGFWSDAQGNFYLTTKGSSFVPGLVGDSHDILLCTNPTVTPNSSCETFTRYWDGDTAGLSVAGIDGLELTSRATISVLPTYPIKGFVKPGKPDGEFPYDAADDVEEADFNVMERLQRLYAPRLYR